MFIDIMEREHYHLMFAIEMWVNTLIELCDENCTSSYTYDYRYFIANVLNSNNPAGEAQMKQAIEDFYDYFYTNQHICDVNSMTTLGQRAFTPSTTNLVGDLRSPDKFGDIDNNYGNSNTKLRLLDTLKKIEHNEQSKYVFQTITIYVFQLCCSLRKDLGLPIFDDRVKDTSIVKYFTRCT